MEYMLMPFRRYAEFSGRSGRKEFWMFMLLNFIVYCVVMALMFALGSGASLENAAAGNYLAVFGGVGLIMVIWALLVLIPAIAVSVRRLHDRDLSGWWYLGFIVVSIIPLIGFLAAIAYIVVMALPGHARAEPFRPRSVGAGRPGSLRLT